MEAVDRPVHRELDAALLDTASPVFSCSGRRRGSPIRLRRRVNALGGEQSFHGQPVSGDAHPRSPFPADLVVRATPRMFLLLYSDPAHCDRAVPVQGSSDGCWLLLSVVRRARAIRLLPSRCGRGFLVTRCRPGATSLRAARSSATLLLEIVQRLEVAVHRRRNEVGDLVQRVADRGWPDQLRGRGTSAIPRSRTASSTCWCHHRQVVFRHGSPWRLPDACDDCFSRLKGTWTPLRLTTFGVAVSKVEKRRPGEGIPDVAERSCRPPSFDYPEPRSRHPCRRGTAWANLRPGDNSGDNQD